MRPLLLLLLLIPGSLLFCQSRSSLFKSDSSQLVTNGRTQVLTCNNWLSTTIVGSGVKIGDLDVSGTNVTVEAVFNRNAPYSGSFLYAGNIVSKHTGPTNTNYLLRPNSAEITTSNGYFVTSSPCLFNLNKTYHVAMVYNGSTLKFYRNGYLMSQVNATGNLYQNDFITTIAEHALGTQTPPETLLGYINEVRIWNVARSQTEIRNNMSGSLPNPATQAGLLAYYTFDNLLNKQGNPAWNGTLIGNPTINATNPACTYVADSCNVVPAVTANFTAPDTVCINTPVNITNTSVGASSYYWNFCPPDLNITPQAVNLGNIGGILSQPVFMDFANDNGTYYGFSTNYSPGKLIRLNFGNSLLNIPTVTDLGNFGGIIPSGLGAEGLQVAKNEGKWYVIIVGGSTNTGSSPRIVKVDFGTSIINATPVATNWGNIGNLAQPIDFMLFAENNIWYGLTVNSENNTITRFNFTSSFNNVPIGTNLGNLGNLNYPTGIHAINDNGTWRVFITNGAYNSPNPNPSITRLDFGSSLLNLPTATNLGNPGSFLRQPRDITIFSTCGQAFGYVVDGVANSIVKLNFNGNLQSAPVATSLGNIGNLSFPHSISKLFRSGPDLYAFVTNVNNNTITRLQFAGCLNSSIPNSSVQNPPSIIYTTPGTYSISLAVDEGLITQTAYCKQVVVLAKPTVISRADTTLCLGSSIQLNTTATGATTFSWSPVTGLSNPLITSPIATPTVTTTYIVTASNGYCTAKDTVVVNVVNNCNGINNIINAYTPVTGYQPCDNKITVESDTAFNVGDTVLLIQMKGAIIDTTNTAAFGTVTNYANAGNYEFNYVKSKLNNVIELKNKLTRQYTIPDGKVQLIRVPYFYSTNVSSTLTCLPWDGSKGGVLAFNVRDTLTLNADIDVSEKGFRGGLVRNSSINSFTCGINNFYYPINTIHAAGKGESISDLDSLKNAGRGNKASGGGGGMSPNTGGGGGGNGNIGGKGGYGYGDCPGYLTDQNWGLGGYSLLYNNAQSKIYLGGGGGAGHCNNGFENPAVNTNFNGGNGGGIVIISSNKIVGNNKTIKALGAIPYELTAPGYLAHDGMGGGGAGGAVLINAASYISTLNTNVSGARGGNMSSSPSGGRVGPGGGGAGGVVWVPQPSTSPLVAVTAAGGTNGVILQDGNNPYGATSGLGGITLNNLVVPIDTVLFQKNIDSTRIKDSLTGCSSFDFKGISYTHNSPVVSWQWMFGDGTSATTQNAVHSYPSIGSYLVKLFVSDATGCKDSISKVVNITGSAVSDFSFRLNPCNPLSVQFVGGAGSGSVNDMYWSFGDGTTTTNMQSLNHLFNAPGSYTIRYSNSSGNCIDTVVKVIPIGTQYQDLIQTLDTTICFGSAKQLRADSSNAFCWSPVTNLNNPFLSNPVTNTQIPTVYHYTSLVADSNLLINGNFSQGNTGFTSGYIYSNTGSNSGQYYVGANAGSWLNNGTVCNADHTTGTGNMLMVNGSTTANVRIWSQTVAVVPNTTYEMSGWLSSLSPAVPGAIQLMVNGIKLDTIVTASGTACIWKRFSTIWNSGIRTNVDLSLVNITTQVQGNDFALDDLSFTPISIKRDSVKINVESPVVYAGNDTAICNNDTTQLVATGAVLYTWTPTIGLLNPNSSSPYVSPAVTTQYIVTGTTVNGCQAKDSVTIQVKPSPIITSLTNDTTICNSTSIQLNAGGGTNYVWLPANTLSNSTIANPVASPTVSTTYNVKVTDNNGCAAMDSVKIAIQSPPVFAVQPAAPSCLGKSVQLRASGGDKYLWTPATGLSSDTISNPVAVAALNSTYSVKIIDNTCRDSALLTVPLNTLPLPTVQASKSNDIDCNTSAATLTAIGATSYRWLPVTALSNSNAASAVATPITTTTYVVIGVNTNGCSNVDSVTIVVKYEGEGKHYLPNAFTPNGDGLNDCFGIKSWGTVTDLKFSIYNRWGEQVFFTTTQTGCWDGRYKGEIQQSGNFIYIIKAKTSCGNVDMKGNVLLLR